MFKHCCIMFISIDYVKNVKNMNQTNLIQKYTLKFRNNISLYNAEQAKKKNSDIRKTVMNSGSNKHKIAVNKAWNELYSRG